MTDAGIQEPFARQARPFIGTDVGRSANFGDGPGSYLDDPDFAPGHHSLVRSGAVLDRELDLLFDFIEPCDSNLLCFSHKTFALLGRASMEVEALLNLSLDAAGIGPATKGCPNMADYKKLEDELQLSGYRVRLPIWAETGREFRPFAEWDGPLESRSQLGWWGRYNLAKHHRVNNFAKANVKAAVEAVGAALICLFAQVAGRALEVRNSDVFGEYFADEAGWIAGERLFEILPPIWDEGAKYGFDPKATRSA